MRRLGHVVFLLMSLNSLGLGSQNPQPVSIPLRIAYEHIDWVSAPPAQDDSDPKRPVTTQTVLAARFAALSPETGRPFASKPPDIGCDPTDIRSVFRLEKREFLLGEPILVNYRLELNGPGEWLIQEGPTDRCGPNRESGFAFLMRHEDGSWLSDFYPAEQEWCGGIMGGPIRVVSSSPYTHWRAVQQWCAIRRAGTYDLYCLGYRQQKLLVSDEEALSAAVPQDLRDRGLMYRDGELVEADGTPAREYAADVDRNFPKGPAASPLVHQMPAELVVYLGSGAADVTSFARFKIRVREGSAAEQQKMIDDYVALGDTDKALLQPNSPEGAARDGILWSHRDDFLPTITSWLHDSDYRREVQLEGIALRGDSRAVQVLLAAGPEHALFPMKWLPLEQIPATIPLLIEWLTDDRQIVRTTAEDYLVRWTGKSFKRGWVGYDYRRPSLDEAVEMQPLWRLWWKGARQNFKAIPPRNLFDELVKWDLEKRRKNKKQ